MAQDWDEGVRSTLMEQAEAQARQQLMRQTTGSNNVGSDIDSDDYGAKGNGSGEEEEGGEGIGGDYAYKSEYRLAGKEVGGSGAQKMGGGNESKDAVDDRRGDNALEMEGNGVVEATDAQEMNDRANSLAGSIRIASDGDGSSSQNGSAASIDRSVEEMVVRIVARALAAAWHDCQQQCAEEGERVRQLGGLHVIGTSVHESRRIDNQVRACTFRR